MGWLGGVVMSGRLCWGLGGEHWCGAELFRFWVCEGACKGGGEGGLSGKKGCFGSSSYGVGRGGGGLGRSGGWIVLSGYFGGLRDDGEG